MTDNKAAKKTKKADSVRQELSARSKFGDIVVSALFLLIIFGFGIAIFIIPDKTFSEDENRTLQVFPSYNTFTAFTKALFEGKIETEINDYYADQFPLRDLFVGAKAINERILLKGQNNDVVFGKDGYLITRFDYSDEELLEANLNRLNSVLSPIEIPSYIIVPPRTQDALMTKLPDGYPTELSDALFSRLDGMLDGKFIDYIELRSKMIAADAQDLPVYYKTDHHWTTLGAKLAYETIAGKIGFTAASEFTTEVVTESFFGTTWSKAGAKWIMPDKITSYSEKADDAEYTVSIMKFRDGSDEVLRTMDGFYEASHLETKDKYAYFLDGNFADVRIKKSTDENRETILVLKDSFANSLVPFLAINYDIRLIDPRQYTGTIKSIAESEDIAFILCCFNMDFLTTNSLRIA